MPGKAHAGRTGRRRVVVAIEVPTGEDQGMTHGTTAIERRARTWLTEAVRSRDTVTVSALRGLLSAIANAQAVPAPPALDGSSPHVAGATAGVGSTEAARRELSESEVADLLRGEILERHAALDALGGRGERAERLRAEAVVLEVLLQGT